MKYVLGGLMALAAAGSAEASALVCKGVFYTKTDGPMQIEVTITLDAAKTQARMPSDIGWVAGSLTLAPDRYTGQLVSKDGGVRFLTLERYTGDMLLEDRESSRVIYQANCKAAEARF
ncbi:hypothetical protein [Stenotrophomonas sp. SAU14A_NAIMI4_8]|uniref:hypothetical protein n=1 Tax=Stenotrophomonas sp. SAU14A_NAIMI4_8 TaxID=2072409 RepID=UPI000D53FB5E|nr:hypothetical protein [Stenotrophomonas sp. SAU14A_NAIMI4_8]AWH32237.1 hypothetical protein C1930_04800 [Stenotrophomonas sp. SAU14A_NAIMI4_8]